jgi:hypothetical protein
MSGWTPILAAVLVGAMLCRYGERAARGATADCFSLTPAAAGGWQPMMLSDNPSDAEQGPVTVNNRSSNPWFDMEMPTGALDFKYHLERNTIKQAGTTSTTTSDTFQETVSLVTTADVVSANLLDLKLGGTVGLEQDFYDAAGQRRSSDDVLDDWDVSGTILRNEFAPLTLYGRRTEQIVTPDFSPSLQSIDTTYGGNLQIRSDSLPTQFELYHSDDSQNQLTGGDNNFTLSQDVFHWHTDAVELPHQSLAWDYNFRNTDEQESGGGPIHYQTHDADLTHGYYFGAAGASSLTSTLSADVQTGDLAYQRYHYDENLQLQHTPNLQSHYDYSLEQDRSSGVTQTINTIDVGLVHHLFRSLVSSADAGGSLVDATGNGQTPQVYGRTNFSYTKLIPDGTLLANLNFGWQWEQSPAGTQPIPVINQALTFNNSQPLALTQTNIDPNSIQVLGTNGVPFVNGRDFAVNTVGHLIQIERVIGGLIPAGGSVLLDYDLFPQAAHTTNTGNAGFGLRDDIDDGLLKGFSPYARYDLQRQTVDSSTFDPTLIPDSYDDAVVGTDYRFWMIVFNAEQQWYHSTISPYNASRFSARYNSRLNNTTTGTLSGSYALIDYYGEQDYVKDASVTAALETTLARGLTARGRVVWLDDEDRLFGSTRGVEEQLEMEWTHNQTHVYARVRNATLSTQAQESTFQVFEIGITRHF